MRAGRRVAGRLWAGGHSRKAQSAAELEDYRLISASALFNPDWYLHTYPDVKAVGFDPLTHYLAFGAGEGRNPSPHFDTTYYLDQYPDVGQSGMNALVHFLRFGHAEGRRRRPETDAPTGEEEYQAISSSRLFDGDWYLEKYPAVKAAGADPVAHYIASGAGQRMDPSRFFSTSYYLRRYPDVGYVGMNPLTHYLTYGQREDRQALDPNSYDYAASDQWKAALRAHPASTQVAAENPKVSVVMPTKDRKARIGDAILSVVRQTHQNWELIVIDDHSADGTLDLIRERFAGDSRIKVATNDGHGVGEARNSGLARATGAFIAYLDSDNRWHDDYLELMLRAIERDKSDCGYAVQKCYRDPFVDDRSSVFYRNNIFDYEQLKLYNYIDLNIFVHRASLIGVLGRFDTSLKRMVDWDLVLRYCKGREVTKAEFVGVNYDAGPSKDRITNRENRSYLYAVRNKHLIDWDALVAASETRDTALVSIVMCVYGRPDLTKDCLESLYRHEAGEPFELVLVDNASDEATHRLLLQWRRKRDNIRIIHNPENFNFALGNNVGFAATKGSRIVFLNNDTVVSPEWLRSLVNPLNDPSIKGTQSKLVYPDGSIQCVGVVFPEQSPLGYPIYSGQPGNFAPTATPRNYRAVTAAAFAMRAADFAGAQGFDPVFVNGQEDVDLCLRVGGGAPVFRYVPDSVIIHHESKTPDRGRHIERNRDEFVQRWRGAFGPDDAGYYAADGHQVGAYKPDNADWVESGLASWRPVPGGAATANAGYAARFDGATIAIKIGCPRPEMKDRWGDYHFAVALAAALQSRGVRARIDFLHSWPTVAASGDINLVLRGLSHFQPAPDTSNVVWMISHPDKVTGEELDGFDHVFVASTIWAGELVRSTRTPVEALLQCTDPGRFNPDAYDENVRSRALFVANSRKVLRPVVREAEAQGVELDIYGEMWDGLAPDEWIKGDNISNVDLPRYYASAGVVLNDHWPSMRDGGFVSNRVFDVLACGGKLITDSVVGMPAEIESACQFFDRGKSLRALVSATGRRKAPPGPKARAIAAMVHRNHSFDARAEIILARLAGLVKR